MRVSLHISQPKNGLTTPRKPESKYGLTTSKFGAKYDLAALKKLTPKLGICGTNYIDRNLMISVRICVGRVRQKRN